MKVKIGITVSQYQGIRIAQLLDLVRLSGIEFIEISRDIFSELDQVKPKIRNFITSFHLPLIPEDGWDFSCIEHRDKIDDLIDKLNAHQLDLNIQQYVAHPPEPKSSKTTLRTSIDFLFDNLAKLQRPIYLENIPELAHEVYLQTVVRAKENLAEQFGGLCFDGPHYFLSGYDPAKMLLDLNSQVRYVHLSDCSNDRDLHQPFSANGAFPIHEVLATLKELQYSGWINLEIQPRSIKNINSLMSSYLLVLRRFRPMKYLLAKARMSILIPVVQHRINHYLKLAK